MKKALIVANLGGFASFLKNDITILQKMGYEITYAANANKLEWSDTYEWLKSKNVRFVQVDCDSQNPLQAGNLEAYKQVKKLLAEGQFDLIHCHTPIIGALVRVAANRYRRKGTKVIYTTHGFSFASKSSWKKKLFYQSCETVCAKLCDAIVTINREDFAAAKKMKRKNVFYIHGVGVDIKRYQDVTIDREAYRRSLGVADDEVMVLSVGELSTRKNHQIIIKALSQIKSDRKYVYVICGNGINGGTGQMLQEEAEKHNVRLLLLGFRSDIPQITKCSDVGAIPSIREGLGLAGVQSLAAGVPIVGTDVQGIHDYIKNNETGFLCDAYDAEAFAAGIEAIVSMKQEEKEKMEANCVAMAQQFDISVSWKEMEDIYQTMLP